jgi:spermidine synthase
LTGYVAAITLLAWPHGITWERIYSPYQLIERGPGEHGHSLIRAAGQYYQRIHNLSSEVIETTRDEGQRLTAAYYEFPYRVFPTPRRDVAIVGAGTGNDVAAALRTGAGHVDAVEIDPAIILLGKMYHPERPFDNPRVRVISDDARAFFRAGGTSYDLIVFGLLDSHTLLSHASNVRLDSFVYTVEGLREARARLEPDGVIALSFSVLSPELGRKIHLMLEQAFDGRPPRAFRGRYNYDGSVIFLARNSDAVTIPPDALSAGGFRDVTSTYADPLLQADPSTDDWPFFYMPRRVYPLSYLGVVGLLLALSILLIARLIPDRPTRGDWPFFLMGAGFMLLQTKGITELALAYGNTWRVVGIVIVAMLGFAFLANLIVERRGVMDPRWALLGVIVALLLGLWQTRTYGPGSSAFGRWGATLLVASPVFFSGLAFSGLLLRAENLSRVLAANLLGSLVGGLLEYNSMYFGFQFLHILAAVIYGLAFIAISIPVKASRLPLPQRSIQSG